MLLSSQIEFIRAEIDKSAIYIQEIKEDLLDHICCLVEEKMEMEGLSFEIAYQQAIQQVCPDGLNEIQKETTSLLNADKRIHMKKAIYGIGLISAMTMSLGFLFRIMHLPGGEQMLNFGFIGLCLIFLPLIAIYHFQTHRSIPLAERLKLVFGYANAEIVASELVLEILDLFPATILLIVGCILFTFGFLPFLFFDMYKKSLI